MPRSFHNIPIALAGWLALSVSVGWYYTFTYYGHTGLPVPTPEVMSGLILYYFSVLNAPTEIQALHWVLTFPITGFLWTLSLALTASRFNTPRPSVPILARRLALANLPLIAPLPWMTALAGTRDGAFTLQRMLDVALRHGGLSPWPGLNLMYIALGLATLALQAHVYRTTFNIPPRQAILHAATAAIALILAASLLGALAALPLRATLE